MTLLTKQQILAVEDLTYRDVYVDEWGGEVRVRVMTGAERDRVFSQLKEGDDPMKQRAFFLSVVVVDSEGKALFTPDEIATKSYKVLDKLEAVAYELNGLGTQGVDDAEKN